MVKVKICGITREEDAVACLRAGADYLGFNFCAESPRRVTPERTREILDFLGREGLDSVRAVGVFTNSASEEIREIARVGGLGIVQLHGQESPEDLRRLEGLTRIKAIAAASSDIDLEMERYEAEFYLADTPHPTLSGGTGTAYDYSLVAKAARRHRVFLAGGLRPENVAEAIRAVGPYAVDVASGVEISPGLKDARKVEEFCKAARTA